MSFIVACSSDNEATAADKKIEESIEPAPQNTDKVVGDWKNVNSGTNENTEEIVTNPYNSSSQSWVISNDSIKIYEYPFHFVGAFKYRILENTLYYTIEYLDDKTERKIVLNSDSLKVTTVHSNKGSEKIITYYEREDLDTEVLDYLDKDKIDWSKYAGKWKYASAHAISTGYLIAGHLNFEIPKILDLWEANKANKTNYTTDKKKLVYNEDGVAYSLFFLLHKTEGDKVVSMTLKVSSPRGEEYGLLYKLIE